MPASIRVVCKSCGYVFCWWCSSSFCGEHQHSGVHMNGLKPNILRVPAVHTETDELYWTSMRITALLNTRRRMEAAQRTQTLNCQAFSMHVVGILGRDKSLGRMATELLDKQGARASIGSPDKHRDLIWTLARLLVTKYLLIGHESDGYFMWTVLTTVTKCKAMNLLLCDRGKESQLLDVDSTMKCLSSVFDSLSEEISQSSQVDGQSE